MYFLFEIHDVMGFFFTCSINFVNDNNIDKFGHFPCFKTEVPNRYEQIVASELFKKLLVLNQ